ncbi:hypothetical protein D1818_01210 [Aquimarina sp. BL5]|nr:hypothetical protein D1818_01210 [Aquimarina sp. BL5]RKN02514.1 hypothetical protein D7036_16455 [Aquimarina sp. BL5]
MPMSDIYRKCPNCGTLNLNSDYCKECGTLINTVLRRKQERKQRLEKKAIATKSQRPNKITLFFERVREHPNVFIRYTARFFYSIWIVVLAIGSFLAFIIGYIAA